MRVVITPDVFISSEIKEKFLCDCIKIPEFYEADVRVINLEQPLGDRFYQIEKSTLFEGPWVARKIFESKINIVSLANNHIHDLGEKGIIETIDTLVKLGIKVVGAGKNLNDARKGVDIGQGFTIFSFCDFDKKHLKNVKIAQENSPGVNPLTIDNVYYCLDGLSENRMALLLFHWGRENVFLPCIEDVNLAKKILQHPKVFSIIGSHSHTLQGVLLVNGKKAFMSLGNFLFPNFTIKPKCQYYSEKHDPSKLPVIYDYHDVTEITRKKWRKRNRISSAIVFNTNEKEFHQVFALQDREYPVVQKISGFYRKILVAKIGFLSFLFKLPCFIYWFLSETESFCLKKKRFFGSIVYQVKNKGVLWFLKGVQKKINHIVRVPFSIKQRFVLELMDKTKVKMPVDEKKFEVVDSIEKMDRFLNLFQGDVKLIEDRISKGCALFLFLDGGEIAGQYWGLSTEEHAVYFDKYYIMPDTVFLFNAIVYDKFRGKGIYRKLISLSVKYYLDKSSQSKTPVRIIVEKNNLVSMHINRDMGFEKYRRNILVKVFGRNFFSILTNPLECHFVYKKRDSI